MGRQGEMVMREGYHKTKDGRIVQKGLYYYSNKKKKEGRKPRKKGDKKRPTAQDWYNAAQTAVKQ